MTVVLLTSGATLGTHVPALILAGRLRTLGIDVHVEVFERLLRPDELDKLRAAKVTFRSNFKLAVAAQRMVRDQLPALDEAAVGELLRRWRAVDVDHLVIFSGFWVPVVERYEASTARAPRVDVCHLDAASTASFNLFRARTERYRHVWMFDAERGTAPTSIRVTDEQPVPWQRREPRLLAHGGGWGLGTYRTHAAEFAQAGLLVDVVAHDPADVAGLPAGCRTFMIDPTWEAWQDDGFPPFGEVGPDGTVEYRRGRSYHDSFDLARQSVAMLCKTGGGTLIDSLWSATPIVLLAPFGAHEQVNADLWRRLGYGVTEEEWRRSGYSLDLLETLHRNLLAARDGVADYATELAAQVETEVSR
ncbi:hypothetical protein SAMN05443287_108171 [Micromonospora phaseoli]|uniref:UDP:flavonoid glycosyltransferase YjiC, YdhE family n=1 Tax=Micromonospora phaseoli TaxID=1144548 RepID=A0A1H7C0I9_9ACTN|nr:hypothetical protein [Micromonospora phaseoli]PZV92690.1 hypothetical protein CLV64_110113 [Micromonospora phaseoli]GIJ76656.1 hypothetical protein Xph01_10880 [Micromonospora phaseoli]SEJ83329.1 hypothetical protein SAMN05443287_108171 [Micromonospora phaseoli]